MSYNGSGTFVINTAGQPVVSGTVISSTAFNALTADLATGLSTAITKDGQTTPTANIPMGNNKITGLAVGTAATDAANLSQVQSTAAKLVNSVSGVDTITGTMSPTLAAYAAGQMFYFVAAGDNTGAVTLNLDGLGAKAVTRDGSVALAAGDIKSGEVVVVVYDGTRFQVVSQLNSAGNATFANVSITSALNVGGVATFTGNPVLSGGTANGVLYLNGSKVATSGSALVFDGTNLGIGTSSPVGKLDVADGTNPILTLRNTAQKNWNTNDPIGYLDYRIDDTSSAGARTVAYVRSLVDTGVSTGITVASNLIFGTAAYDATASERMRLDAAGNLGLAVTPSAWGNIFKVLQGPTYGGCIAFQTTGPSTKLGTNWYYDGTNYKYTTTNAASRYDINDGTHIWYNAASGTAGNTITFTQAMTLSADGSLGVGTTSPAAFSGYKVIDINGSTGGLLALTSNGTNKFQMYVNGSSTTLINVASEPLIFGTNNTERARITSGGDFLVGTTTVSLSSTQNGVVSRANGELSAYKSAATVCFFNRNTDDGTIVSLRQADVEEGTISVSGNTVSYNAFAGSHWSQLQDGSKPDILRGTVMESINELCVWPDENNERLPKAKISDTAGSKKVYGVFMAWDNDWTETNDMYVTAVGAFICRVNGSVTVQEGDLLESNGDGTARVQADDIIRSSTIGKVTSTVKTHQYDDGSYCVPTVLYCG